MDKVKGSKGISGFHTSVGHGDYGEYKVKKLFSEHYGPSIEYAEDKSLDKMYQKAGIDLIIQYHDGAMSTVEVKTDSSTNPNIFYEIISQSKPGEKDVPGCMLTTEAEYIFYVFEQLDIVLMLPVKDLREWVNAYLEGEGYLETRDVTNFSYISRGYLIPIERLMGAHAAWSEVHRMRALDIKTGKPMTYEAVEERRLLVEEINKDETLEPFTTREKYWEIENKKLWVNNGVLSYATKGAIENFKKKTK